MTPRDHIASSPLTTAASIKCLRRLFMKPSPTRALQDFFRDQMMEMSKMKKFTITELNVMKKKEAELSGVTGWKSKIPGANQPGTEEFKLALRIQDVMCDLGWGHCCCRSRARVCMCAFVCGNSVHDTYFCGVYAQIRAGAETHKLTEDRDCREGALSAVSRCAVPLWAVPLCCLCCDVRFSAVLLLAAPAAPAACLSPHRPLSPAPPNCFTSVPQAKVTVSDVNIICKQYVMQYSLYRSVRLCAQRRTGR